MGWINKNKRRAAALLLWLVLWQLAAAVIHNKIIFVGPWEAAAALLSQIRTGDFWRTILFSFWRIAGGFLGAFAAGIAAAALAARLPLLGEFLEPPVALLQSVPVASFVILALIWIGSRNLSVLVTCLVVFPVIYRNVLEGIRQTDRGMLEMAQVFRIDVFRRVWYLYRPSVMPYLTAGCRVALGMAWKSGVAAEVIGVPDHSIGEKLYMAKIYLSTEELFAWTFVIIVVSKLFELLFLRLLGMLTPAARKKMEERGRPSGGDGRTKEPALTGARMGKAVPQERGTPLQKDKPLLWASGLGKSYHGRTVLKDVSVCLKAGRLCCLMGPSGQGKTTLLRLLMGLESPDAGEISGPARRRISAVFQEDRLCGYLDAVANVRLAAGRDGFFRDPTELLGELLEKEALYRPVQELSGGMKRRVAVARALAACSDVVLMDEPFTGLDAQTRLCVLDVIRRNLGGRALLVVTHQEEDAAFLEADVVRWDGSGSFSVPSGFGG